MASLGSPGHAWPRLPKITSPVCSFNRYVPACKKINFLTLKIFETLKPKNPAIWLADSISTFNHAQLKLHDQFVALTDMKMKAQNQLYTSIGFWDIKVVKASLGMPGHTSSHPPKITQSICNFNRYELACKKSNL